MNLLLFTESFAFHIYESFPYQQCTKYYTSSYKTNMKVKVQKKQYNLQNLFTLLKKTIKRLEEQKSLTSWLKYKATEISSDRDSKM